LKSMLRRRTLLFFLLALLLRLLLQGWDAGVTSSSSHPDERHVGFVTERAEGWFADPGFYAYGSLHFHAIRATASVLGLSDEIRGIIVSGRVISLVAAMLAIGLGWWIAYRAWGRRTGDLFILLAAWVPLDLQQSHFATVEAHHTGWVMAALAACFWLARSGRPIAAAASGAAIGASLAVKVASLALGLPLILAVLIAVRRRNVFAAVRLLAIAGATGIAGFWLCQPWAFANGRPPFSIVVTALIVVTAIELANRKVGHARSALLVAAVLVAAVSVLQMAALVGIGGETFVSRLGPVVLAGAALNPTYLEGIGNEVAMVVGTTDVAYVRIYAHTLPVLYPLRELALWGWGVLLVLAVIAGSAACSWHLTKRWRRWVAGRFNDSSILLAILLAWLVPMALRLSTLQVKFMRYWEPLVVPAALIASWWLMRLPRRFRRRAVISVAAGTVLWGLSYTWAFIEPHPHRTASEWFSPMLADQQVVAFEHWDEHIGLHLEKGVVERAELPSYELPENDEKIALWTGALARSDWVVLTSNRVYRTVLANPDRFEETARLYRLLLSGEAGFEVLARVRRGPRTFGLRWPVQRADESFLNYEFPQVVILRRVADINPEELAERVSRPLPHLEQMGHIDLEKNFLSKVPAVPPVPSKVRQVFDLTIWIVVFSGLGLAFWALLLPILRGWPDAGVGLALATGWIVPAWLMWMGSELGIWEISPATATWVYLTLLAAGAFAAISRWSTITTILRRRRTGVLAVLAVAAVIGALFLVVRAWNPAIFWGEKPMDFSFLNAFLRAPHWPPGEPWMAGMPLHYYYFGEVLAAYPMLVAGCSSGVGYNLISATIPALFAGVLAGIGLLLTRRKRPAIAASVLPLLVLLSGNLAWPWLIKTLRDGNIFDFWWATSRVIPGFAIDEYPLWTTLFADLHGHFIAFPVLLATLAWGWLCVEANDRKWMVSAALCGVGAATVVATNPWDLFILTTTLGFGVVVAARRPLRGLIRLSAAASVSVLAAAPFIVELVAGISAGAAERGLFLTDADFAPAWAILRHFGLFLIPLAVLAIMILGRRFWIVLPTAAVGVIAGLLFKSSAAALALAATAVFATVAIRSRDRLDRLGWSMAALGTLAVAACERFTLIDRMNTIFKVYNGVWVLLAFALAAALMRTRGRRARVLVAVWVPLQLVAIVNLPLGIAQGWKVPRITSPRPTLDGQAFLATQDPQTWFLVRGLQGMARPGVVVAEAAGHYYSDFTRITMHTGQPTVVGWDWHLKQRGQSATEIAARAGDLEVLYSGGNREKRRAVLDRYRVGWAVAARIERNRYEISEEDPLGDIPGVEVIAERDGAVLYRVLPRGALGAQRLMAADEQPSGMGLVGRLVDVSNEIVRSIALDDSGATAILRGGSMVELDLEAQRDDVLEAPPCDPMAVARHNNERWVACRDGSFWQYRERRWFSAGRISGAEHVVADERVWAWGPGGLWLHLGDTDWRQVFSARVTAAAANGQSIAWSEGSKIWVSEGAQPQKVGEGLEGVRAISWQGDVLWVLDSVGLHRAGGIELPWQRVFDKTDNLVEMAGSQSRLWLVRDDGFVFEPDRQHCPSPWTSQPESRAGSLREPRGIAVSPAGWFAVADTFNHRILYYSDEGRCLDSVGEEGTAPREFHEPSSVALSGDGSLAVADTWNGRIQVLRPNGVTEVFGRNLFGPRDLMWAPDGSLLVSDTGNRKLLRFAPPDWEDETIATLPGPPVGLAWAAGLIAVAVPAEGALLLVDGSTGDVARRIELRCWNTHDQQEGYLALLPSGNLVASSPHYGELWIVDPTEEEPQRLLQDGLPGVTAIALTPFGDLIASLTWEHRLVRVPIEN
jgi:YYY domain-containing protein